MRCRGLAPERRVEIGIAHRRDDHRVPAGEHGHRRDERAGRGRVDEIGEHEDQRPLAPAHACGTRGRSRCRRRSARRRGSCARRPARRATRSRAATADRGVEHGRPRTGRRARRRRARPSSTASTAASSRVVRGVERRRHQAARVEQAHDVAVLFDAVLVAHRPADALGRRPVDLADVVVGLVVADRLELGSEPERPARAQAGIAELARGAARPRGAARRRRRGTRGAAPAVAGERARARARAARGAGPPPAGEPRRRGGARSRRASSAPRPTDGSISTSAGWAWRISIAAGRRGVGLDRAAAAATPRENVRGTVRRTRSRWRASAMSTTVAITTSADQSE